MSVISRKSFQNGVRTRCAAIVNHRAIVKILRVVNLLRVVFLVRRGPLGIISFEVGRKKDLYFAIRTENIVPVHSPEDP